MLNIACMFFPPSKFPISLTFFFLVFLFVCSFLSMHGNYHAEQDRNVKLVKYSQIIYAHKWNEPILNIAERYLFTTNSKTMFN